MRLRSGFDRRRCDRIDSDGWCYYDEAVDDGDPSVPFGLSLGFVGAVLPTQLQGLWGDRVLGPDLDVGALAPLGVDARIWTGWDRFRIGALVQGGGVPASGPVGRSEDAFEDGSSLTDGWWLSLYGVAAYQPHLDDVVQLWLGGRLGGHLLGLPVTSLGRPYDSVRRSYVSAGPEVGVRFSAGPVGLMIWGFADLASPGLVQLTAAFVVEGPKPPGAAF